METKCLECDRLKAINAELLASLKGLDSYLDFGDEVQDLTITFVDPSGFVAAMKRARQAIDNAT